MSDVVNDPDDNRAPDPDAAVLSPRTERPGGGRDLSDDDDAAEESLPPGSATKDGEPSDDARAQPYDEQPIGLRMHDEG